MDLDARVDFLMSETWEDLAKKLAQREFELIKEVNVLKDQLEKARTYKGIEDYPCPLCTLKKGKFIKFCAMHKKIDFLQGHADKMNEHYKAEFHHVDRLEFAIGIAMSCLKDHRPEDALIHLDLVLLQLKESLQMTTKTEIARLSAELDVQHKMLKRLEWAGKIEMFPEGDLVTICPVCRNIPSRGHRRDCELAFTLAIREGRDGL